MRASNPLRLLNMIQEEMEHHVAVRSVLRETPKPKD